MNTREQIGMELNGIGFEIGAYFNPWPHSAKAQVFYVDKYSRAELRELFKKDPNLQNSNYDIDRIPQTHHIESGEVCSSLPNDFFDFCLSSHMLEHAEDPIRTLAVWLTKLKIGGRLIAFVPDSGNPFDKMRAISDFKELLGRRMYEGVKKECLYKRMMEWCLLVDRLSESEAKKKVKAMIAAGNDIHFNVWDLTALKTFIENCKMIFDSAPEVSGVSINFLESFEIEKISPEGGENLICLTKIKRSNVATS